MATGLVALVLVVGFGVRAQERARRYVSVTDAMLQKPDASEWLMWRRTLDGWASAVGPDQSHNVSQLMPSRRPSRARRVRAPDAHSSNRSFASLSIMSFASGNPHIDSVGSTAAGIAPSGILILPFAAS